MMPTCCICSSMACMDASQPCTWYSSMESKHAEYLHVGLVAVAPRIYKSVMMLMDVFDWVKHSEWLHVYCDEVIIKLHGSTVTVQHPESCIVFLS